MMFQAEGWYQDPYALHEDRYFSQGLPTKLVCDGGHEAYDPPPDRPVPQGQLTPAETSDDKVTDGSDLRRADDAAPDPDCALRDICTDIDKSSGAT